MAWTSDTGVYVQLCSPRFEEPKNIRGMRGSQSGLCRCAQAEDYLDCDDSDIEEGSAAPAVLPPGPATYEETLNTMGFIVDQYCQRMPSEATPPPSDHSVRAVLESMITKKVTIATDYSGCGTPEMASDLVSGAVQERGLGGPLFRHHRARESDVQCQRILAGYPDSSRPKHILTNILDRLKFDQQFVKNKLNMALIGMENTCKAAGADASRRCELVREHGRDYARWLWKHLSSKYTNLETQCVACESLCPVHPAPADRRDSLYMLIVGNTCTPWSQMGKRLGWLHECTAVYLCFLQDALRAAPEFIISECTPSFDHELMEELTGGMYVTQSMVFSPVDLGLPARRRRRYTISIRKDMFVFNIPWNIIDMSFAWRRLVVTGRMFFRAPKSLVDKALDAMAQQAGLPSKLPPQHYLCPGSRRRLVEHVQKATDNNMQFLCANIRQGTSFSFNDKIPAMTQSSTLLWGIDLRAKSIDQDGVDRPMVAIEQYGVHGFPVLLDADHKLALHLPKFLVFRNIMKDKKCTISEGAMKKIAGNGMHVAMVGLAIVHCLLGLSTVKTESAIGPTSPASASNQGAAARSKKPCKKPAAAATLQRPMRTTKRGTAQGKTALKKKKMKRGKP